MVKLTGTFSQIQRFNVVVIGDFMLDRYTKGQVQRISPEAPVSILKVQEEETLPGGAGNVALNMASLGANVMAIGRVGMDFSGQDLAEKLVIEGVDTKYLLKQPGFLTPIKNRLVAEGQQLLRVDRERLDLLSKDLEDELIQNIDEILLNIDVIAISDYGKGFLSAKLLSQLILKAKKLNVPIIVDPKGEDFSKYSGADILKPNLKEAYSAAKCCQDEPLEKVAESLFKQCNVSKLLITMSKEGIALFDRSMKRKDYPVQVKEVVDVTGAGDTVLAMIAASIANKIDLDHAILFSNIAASIAIERIGCARISLPEFAKRLLEVDVDNKIFDESHLFALKKILSNQKYLILGLSSQDGMNANMFTILRQLSQSNEELIIYIREDAPDEEFINLLSSLHEVSYIILKKDSLQMLCKSLQPEKVYVLKDRKLQNFENSIEALMSL